VTRSAACCFTDCSTTTSHAHRLAIIVSTTYAIRDPQSFLAIALSLALLSADTTTTTATPTVEHSRSWWDMQRITAMDHLAPLEVLSLALADDSDGGRELRRPRLRMSGRHPLLLGQRHRAYSFCE